MSRIGLAACTITVLGLLAGCGGGSDGADKAETSGPSPSSTSTATDAPSPTPSAEPSSYLPVPDGLTLTQPGTELDFRDPALVAWEPRQDLVGVVGLRVLRVEETTVEKSLVGFELPPSARTATPYFVSTEVGNGGLTDLGGRQLPIYVTDSLNRLIAPTGVDQGFKDCPGSLLPAIFAPGDMARSCLIFLVPQDATLRTVTFRPPEGVVPITWTGTVKDLADRGVKPRKKNKSQGKTG